MVGSGQERRGKAAGGVKNKRSQSMDDKNINSGGAEKNYKTEETRDGRRLKNKLNSKAEVLFFEKLAGESKASQDHVRWLTTSEAAQYLRISISSIKTMIYRGQVRVHKLGRRNRFLREELERLITLSVYKSEV